MGLCSAIQERYAICVPNRTVVEQLDRVDRTHRADISMEGGELETVLYRIAKNLEMTL